MDEKHFAGYSIHDLKLLYQQQSSLAEWRDRPHGYRTEIGYWLKRDDGITVLIPLFDDRTNTKRSDILVAIVARNALPELLAEVDRLRKALMAIHEMAKEDMRIGLAERTSLYQIEADARAALQGD